MAYDVSDIDEDRRVVDARTVHGVAPDAAHVTAEQASPSSMHFL